MKRILCFITILSIFMAAQAMAGITINPPGGGSSGTGTVTAVGDSSNTTPYDGSATGGTRVRLYDGTSAYVGITAGVRTLTLAPSNSNAENLVLTFGNNTNIIGFSSGTGVTTLDFGAMSFTTTGSIGSTGAGKLTKVWAVDAEFTNLPTVNGGPMATALGIVNYLSLAGGTLTGSLLFTGSGGLTSPPITTDIHASAFGTATLGTTALPFSHLYMGASGGTYYFDITGTPGTSNKTLTIPNETGTFITSASTLGSWTSGAGTVGSGDTYLATLQKIDGNVGAKAPIASPTFTGTTTLPDAPSCPAYSTTSATSTQSPNIDGASYCDYTYGPGTGTAGAYTPVITSAPSSGKVRFVTVHFVGGTNGDTVTWTNVDFMGTTGSGTVTGGKVNSYACIIPNTGHAKCSIIAEASTY